uniref:Uncharacterized protein n=1 Tax=Oryza rufipogon TaxID=4529 RepID=A0A0E0NZ76_ORYRU
MCQIIGLRMEALDNSKPNRLERRGADNEADKKNLSLIQEEEEENLQCDMIFPTITRPKSSWIMGANPKPHENAQFWDEHEVVAIRIGLNIECVEEQVSKAMWHWMAVKC